MQKYISFDNDKAELEKILDDKASDKELIKMAEIELNEIISQFAKIEKIETFLLPKDEADKKMQ